MFLDYFNLKTHEHFENVGGKAVTRRSESSVLAKAGQQSSSLALCCLWGQWQLQGKCWAPPPLSLGDQQRPAWLSDTLYLYLPQQLSPFSPRYSLSIKPGLVWKYLFRAGTVDLPVNPPPWWGLITTTVLSWAGPSSIHLCISASPETGMAQTPFMAGMGVSSTLAWKVVREADPLVQQDKPCPKHPFHCLQGHP